MVFVDLTLRRSNPSDDAAPYKLSRLRDLRKRHHEKQMTRSYIGITSPFYRIGPLVSAGEPLAAYRKFKRYLANDHCCWRTSFLLRWNACLTLALSRCRKPQRSGGWRQSAAVP